MSLLVFAGIFLGALAGLSLRKILPEHHLSDESKDAVKLGAGLIATLTALVLGLLINSAKDSFDAINLAMTQSSAKVIMLDRTLGRYGPETQKAREQLRGSVVDVLSMFWPETIIRREESMPDSFAQSPGMEEVQASIRKLSPQDDSQKGLQAQAIQISNEILQARWWLVEQSQIALPKFFFFILLSWFTVLFVLFGLLTAKNGTVVGVFFVCALSLAGAMFLIQEMSCPLAGVMKISSAPLLKTLEILGK